MTNTTSLRSRQPKGVRAGGQFRTEHRADPVISLSDHRAARDTPSGFIAANPVPGVQETVLEVKKANGKVTEVVTYIAGDGSKAVVVPDDRPGRVHCAAVYAGGRIRNDVPSVYVSREQAGGVAAMILSAQDRQRTGSATRAAGVPARGEKYENGRSHRTEDGVWEISMAPVGTQPQQMTGRFSLVGKPGVARLSGMKDTSTFRLTTPITGGPAVDQRVSEITGREGDTLDALLERLEAAYQKRLGKAGLA